MVFAELIRSRIQAVTYGLLDPSEMGLSVREGRGNSVVFSVKVLTSETVKKPAVGEQQPATISKPKVVTLTYGKPQNMQSADDKRYREFIEKHSPKISGDGTVGMDVEAQAPEDLSVLKADVRAGNAIAICLVFISIFKSFHDFRIGSRGSLFACWIMDGSFAKNKGYGS